MNYLLPSQRKAIRQKRVMYAIYGVATPIVLLWLVCFVLVVSGIY
jgi:hypothetical protein